jgi:energy-coupling factor transporter ATP-binding protein EcfA2
VVCEIWIDKIDIGGRKVELDRKSVVCVVGPNSSGKSSLLSAIFARVTGRKNLERASALVEASIDHNIDQTGIAEFINTNTVMDKNNRVIWYGGQETVGPDVDKWIENWANNPRISPNFISAFVHRIPTENRLHASNSTNHIDPLTHAPNHPSIYLYRNPELEEKLNQAAEKLFGISVCLNPGMGQKIGLHVGKYTGKLQNRTQEYANEIIKYPLLEHEGDGVRAALGLVSHIIAFKHNCILVDEPDLYLHPPQAYSLAKQMVELVSEHQLIVASHSARYVQGLVENASERLQLVRLNRDEDSVSVDLVDTSVFSEIKKDPVLRFTEIVDALFYKELVLTEDPADCMLFKTALDECGFSQANDETLWLGCYGKHAFPKFVRVAQALALSPLVVADFDIISPIGDSHTKVLAPLLVAYGEDQAEFMKDLDGIHNSVANNADLNWNHLKKNGLEGLKPYGALYGRLQSLLKALKDVGILVIKEGELESLHSPRLEKKHGVETVNAMLEYDLDCDGLRPLVRFVGELAKRLDFIADSEA